jgi:hypothetical protein
MRGSLLGGLMKRSRTLFVLFMVSACGPSGSSGGESSSADGGSGSVDSGPIAAADADTSDQCDMMDILFVIDNSGSMGQEQQNLVTNFPQFIEVMNGFGLDYRVGVTTTGVSKDWTEGTPLGNIPDDQSGDDGELLLGNSCNMPRRWLEGTDNGVSDIFSCVAEVGTSGPADEMPLAAMKLALGTRLSDTNAGFLREDALLGVVILTDENDCSREDNNFNVPFTDDICDETENVSTYLNFLDGVKGDRGRWATAVIAGVGPGDCSSALGNADEATRLIDFVGQTGDNAVMSSICDGDLAGALQDALDAFDTACKSFPPID